MAQPLATVLHVDDDEALLHLVEKAFEEEAERLRYASASGPEEALAGLASIDGPVILLVDRRLPGGDLWSFVDEVRERSDVAAGPVFVLSGSQEPEAVAEAYRRGASYVTKPMDIEGFFEIARMLDRYAGVVELPGAPR